MNCLPELLFDSSIVAHAKSAMKTQEPAAEVSYFSTFKISNSYSEPLFQWQNVCFRRPKFASSFHSLRGEHKLH